jgi:hypothetical protein
MLIEGHPSGVGQVGIYLDSSADCAPFEVVPVSRDSGLIIWVVAYVIESSSYHWPLVGLCFQHLKCPGACMYRA